MIAAIPCRIHAETRRQAPTSHPHATVVDAATRAPVAGAVVNIVGRAGTFRTDAAGRFDWPSRLALPVVAVVSLSDGRMAQLITVQDFDPATGPVLAVVAGSSEFVTVIGIAPAIDLAPGGAAVTLWRHDLSIRQPATVAQSLETVAGVSTIAEGQSAVPTLRGLARGRTLLLLDGARVSSERRAGPSASFVDPDSLNTISVARGPASVAYGSDAFGGVIALRTRRPDREAPFTTRVAITAGDGVPERRASVELSQGYGSSAWLIAARTRDVDEYSAPDGQIANSGWRDHGVRLAWEHDAGAGSLAIGWQSDLGRDLGRPRSDAGTMRTSSPFDNSHRLTMSYETARHLGFSHVTLDGLLAYGDERVDQDRLATPTRPRNLTRADLEAWDTQIRATGERPVGPIRLLVGADLIGRYGLYAEDTDIAFTPAGAVSRQTTTISIDSASRTALGAFAQAEVPVSSWLDLSAGVRADVVHSATRGGVFGDRAVSRGAVAGFGALTITPFVRTSFTVQLARGFRDPTLSDRFYRGPVGRGIIEGNPLLEPETSRQLDLGARYVSGRVRLAASFYDYRITDLVERFADGPDLFRFRNRGSARLRGVELEAQAVIVRDLSVEATGETSRGVATEAAADSAGDPAVDTPLDDVAPARVGLVVRHTTPRGRLSSYLRVARVFAHDDAGPSEVATPAHTPVDAGAIWTVRPGIELRAVVRNLLNERSFASAGPRWVFAPRRHGSVTLVLTF